MTTSSEQAKVALEIVNAIPHGQLPEHHLAADFTAWSPLSGKFSRERYVATVSRLGSIFEPRMELRVLGVTHGQDRVAVEATGSGRLVDGQQYDNRYHFLMAFSGLVIAELREYMDPRPVERFIRPLLAASL